MKPSEGGRNNSHDSIRTRFDSMNSDTDKRQMNFPRIERPIPRKAEGFPWNFNFLLSHLQYKPSNENWAALIGDFIRKETPISNLYMKWAQMQNQWSIGHKVANWQEIKAVKKEQPAPKLKPNKLYDKFTIDDIEEINIPDDFKMFEFDYKSSEDDSQSEVSESSKPKNVSNELSHNLLVTGHNSFMSLVKANNNLWSLKPSKSQEEVKPEGLSLFSNQLNANSLNSNKSDDMIGPLTRKEREIKVKRYLEKKKKRKLLIENIVRYEWRKDLAERRYRFQGRFVKLEDLKQLEKNFIFDSHSNRLIKPIFKTQKVFGRWARSMSKSISISDEDVSMENSEN